MSALRKRDKTGKFVKLNNKEQETEGVNEPEVNEPEIIKEEETEETKVEVKKSKPQGLADFLY